MLKIVDSYKLINFDNNGEEKTIQINTSDAWGVFEYEDEKGKIHKVNEGDGITFITNAGEIKTGIVTKLTGKGEKAKIQMIPIHAEHEEAWHVTSIKEGTLKVIKDDEENEEIENEEE